MTSNVLLYLTVLCCFHSSEAVFELPLDITAATVLLGRVTGQIAAGNDSTLQEFTEIFNYFVNLTQLENESREEVNRQITSNITLGDDDEAAWQSAINDALEEENITTGLNKTLNEEVIEYIVTVVKEPENLRLTYLQSLHASRKDDDAGIDSEEEDMNTEFNPFWDVTLTRRIFNGKRAKIKQFPFVASVHIFSTFHCAGSIIKSDLIITAASCLQLAHNNRFFRENPSFLSVRVGSIFSKVGGDKVPVIEVYFHPTYEPKTLHDNIAIMRLSRLLTFKHKEVKKIDFDKSASALPENTPGITIVGWGSKMRSNKLHAGMSLHAAELNFYDTRSCRKIYGKTFVTRTNFCAGYITKGDGACNRDVGDPGVSGKWLVGVTSFGSPSCGKADTPTVFTKLGYYVDWIEEIMEMTVPRISRSTTTQHPFYLVHRPIKLYGGANDAPIPLLRQLQDLNSEPDQDVDSGPADDDESDRHALRMHSDEGATPAQNVEIVPDIEVDPDIHDINNEPEPENIRIHPPTLIETGNVVDYSQSGENSEERPPMEPVEHTTSLVDFEPAQQDIDVDVENVVRTMKPLDMDYKMDAGSILDLDDHADFADSSKKPVTSMGKIDPEESKEIREETMSGFNPEMDVSTTDNSATTSMTINQDIWVDNENYTALRKIHHMLPVESRAEVANLPNQIENQAEQITNSVSASTDKSIQFRDVPKKLEDIDRKILDKHQDSTENDEEIHTDQPPFKVQERITDDMVKREIQKLITQLELSNEIQNPENEDSGLANDTQLRNLVKNEAADNTKTSETVLTFLYLTDIEKQRRAAFDVSETENENMSIDPAPFQRSMQNMPMQRNELAGKSDIYHIFAKVMDTVVNKTTG